MPTTNRPKLLRVKLNEAQTVYFDESSVVSIMKSRKGYDWYVVVSLINGEKFYISCENETKAIVKANRIRDIVFPQEDMDVVNV